MRMLTISRLALLTLISASTVAFSQAVPGEDPLLLSSPTHFQGIPLGGAPRSGDLKKNPDLKGSLKAKIARLEAKAFSATDDNILTDEDVISASATQGVRRVCRQDVGSTSTSGIGNNPTTRAGRGSTEQIVVLRGDLVNICR